MIGKVLRGDGQRHRLRPRFARSCASLVASLVASFVALIAPAAPVAAQTAPLFNAGLRWIGTARSCTAPSGWSAERLFRGSQLPSPLGEFCLYTWTQLEQGIAPRSADISALFTASQAQNLTEDVPVVYANAFPSAEEQAFLVGLRAALRVHVGDASLLPSAPQAPAVRVVVIDSAPDATSRHGDTLAHLIEDLVCPVSPCAAEVTTVLALPWIARGKPGPDGGHLGTLADVARAIERAVSIWAQDRATSPSTTPARLLLNLSLGWEDTPGIADCSTDSFTQTRSPAAAVREILQYAASQGALIIAAAGNDSGGPAPRKGLVCPGLYQVVAREDAPSQSLLVAASGVDYQDHPLETVRPGGVTGIAGLGLGGVAWGSGDPVPPPLTGSSVATAVVSAVSALAWAYRPAFTPGQVAQVVYAGGTDVGAADACPSSISACRSHRVSVCGALQNAGAPARCSPPAPAPWSSPDLASEMVALAARYALLPPAAGASVSPLSADALPRYQAPTVQVDPYVFPTPISATCRTCVADATVPAPDAQPAPPHLELYLSPRDQVLISPVLVVRFAGGDGAAVALGGQLAGNLAYRFSLTLDQVAQSAYLTGFEPSGSSLTEQIFVQH